MKRDEIKVGGLYTAKVTGKLTTVRVDAIEDCPYGPGMGQAYKGPGYTAYHVTNLATNRKAIFRSAAKFCSKINEEYTYCQGGCRRQELSANKPWTCLECGKRAQQQSRNVPFVPDPLYPEITEEFIKEQAAKVLAHVINTREASKEPHTVKLTVGSRVVFIGPEYETTLYPYVGQRGVVTEMKGLYAQQYGKEPVELITVDFDGDEKPTVLGIDRIRLER